MCLGNDGDGQAVHASRAGTPIAGNPGERHHQRRRITHEVEQVIETPARISHRPTMKLGLHLRYLPGRIKTIRTRKSTAIQR